LELEDAKKGVSGRTLAVAIVIILIAISSIGGLILYFRNGSGSATPPSTNSVGSQTTLTNQPNSVLGFPSYGLQVTRVIVAQGAQTNGYILSVDASFSGRGTWAVNPADFELVSVASTVFALSPGNFLAGMTSPLTPVVLASGQHAAGQLAFQIPTGQTPAKLEYLNQSASINVSSQGMPPISSYVCKTPDPQVTLSTSSASGSNVAYEQGVSPNAFTNPPYYLSGDSLTYTILASQAFGLRGSQNLSVTAVNTNSSGVTISGIRPTLPASMSSALYGQARSVNVTVSTPSTECISSLNLQVTIVPPVAVTSVSFPASGANGRLTISNIGSGQVVALGPVQLNYAGGSCSFNIMGNGILIAAGSSTVIAFNYGNGSPCGSPATSGGSLSGYVTLSNGEQIPFSGTFQGSQGNPPAAHVIVTSVFFSASGTLGTVRLTNTGTVSVYIQASTPGGMSESLTYGGVTCGGASVGASIEILPGSSITYDFHYGSGTPCGGSVTLGEQFSGWIAFSDGEQVQFSGVFQSAPASQFTVTTVHLRASDFLSTGKTSPPQMGCGSIETGSYIILANNPNTTGYATSVTITWAGASNVFAYGGSCFAIMGGSTSQTETMLFSNSSVITANAVVGQSFTGFVSWSDGSQVPFTGTWQISGMSDHVSERANALLAANFKTTGTTSTFTCSAASSPDSIALTNTGSVTVSVTSIDITWAGTNTAFTPSGACNIGAAGSPSSTAYITFPATDEISPSAIVGQTCTVSVTFSDGTQILFNGAWQ
jgi:hypothetical protein